MEGFIGTELQTELPQQVQDQEFQSIPISKLKQANVAKIVSNGNSSEQSWANSSGEVQTRMGLRYLYNGYRILGVNMPKKHKTLYIIWSIVLNFCVTICLPTEFVIGFFHGLKGEIEIGNLLTSLQVAINVVGCSIKIILMAFLLPKLKNCEPIMEKLDKRCITAEERACVRRFTHKGNRLVVLFAIAYWSYSTSTCISAVIFNRLPYNIYNPLVDAQKSLMSFILAVLMEMIPMVVACFQQVVDDSYAVIYVSILRTHLEALLLRIQRMNAPNSSNSLEENLQELKLCIIDHKNIIELYDRVAPVISITIFVQFTITATLLGTTLINILLFATNFASIVASCFYLLAVVVEVFPLCYYAQCLMDENERLSGVIFHSNWVDQDVRYRKLLIFFIQRSQKPIEFTAGKLFPITLSSFLSLKTYQKRLLMKILARSEIAIVTDSLGIIGAFLCSTFLKIAKFSFSLYTLIKEMDIKERYGLK